jgi:ABC-type multidrug transport system fused ATPase/permease subunit
MSVTNELNNDLIVLIIVHLLTTLKNCDQLIGLGYDRILQIGDYIRNARLQ